MNENANDRDGVGRVRATGDGVGRVPSRGVPVLQPDAGSGDPAYNATRPADVGRLSPTGVPEEPPPRRLRRLHRVWPDRDGNISYLVTTCVDGRGHVLDNEIMFERLVAFLLDSPQRYRWFGRRFVIMPDHIHLIAHMGHEAIRIGQWIKALKAVVGGLERRVGARGQEDEERPVGAPGLHGAVFDAGSGDAGSGDPAYNMTHSAGGGRVPPHGDPNPHQFTRIKRAWRWQDGFHDHKFRTPESESRKWEYVCLNPVRAGLVKRPEEWPFGGEIFYDEAGGPRLIRGTPPLLETGMLIEEEDGGDGKTPRGGTRPTA